MGVIGDTLGSGPVKRLARVMVWWVGWFGWYGVITGHR